MRQTRPITIEQVVVASNQPYDKVIGALEARLGARLGGDLALPSTELLIAAAFCVLWSWRLPLQKLV